MPKIVFCCIFVLVFAHVFCLYSEEEEEAFDKKKGHSGCGSYLNSTNGGFNLDITNMSISTCLFHISAESKSTQLILFFKTLFLHKDDVVNVYRSDNKSDISLLDEPIRASNGSITVVLDEKNVIIELSGNNTSFIRDFEGYYTTGNLPIPLDPSVTTIYSPVHPGGKSSTTVEIKYNSPKVVQSDAFSTFVFRQFNFTSPNKIKFDESSFSGDYNDEHVEIFPLEGKTVIITVSMTFPTNETFELKKHEVNSKCSMFKKMDQDQFRFNSPMDAPLNGSDSYECHWLFSGSDPKGKLNVQLNEMEYKSPLDILAVLDGGTEFSPPLLQATSSNLNSTKDIMIRSSGQYLWVAFKPVDFTSSVHATVSKSGGGGGYFKRNGTIAVDNSAEDTTFMLEVDVNQIVYLSFNGNESTLSSGAVVKIYDGFEQKNLLTSLKNGGIWYPVMSQTNKMLVVATGFSKSKFVADFRGENPDCHHMSTFTNENYILSKNCNATCHWVISPQDLPNSELLLNLQYISLQDGDSIEIFLLDSAKTLIGSVSGNVTYVPQIMIPSNVGALVSIARKQDKCVKEDKVFLVGLSSYLPACDNTVTVDALSKFTVVSPQYPDTYPVFGKCKWNISTSKDNLVHIAFDTFKLAQNHCIKINNVTLNVSDGELPEDMVLPGNAIIEFNSGNCVLPKVAAGLQSSEGFKFNGTVADCGSILNQKASGEFEVPPNKTLCIWKVSVPESGSSNDDVNIISFAVNKKDAIGNYELNVYDGASVRDSPMMNTTGSEVWSRTNTLIFIYKRVDPTKPSALLSIKYTTIGCNASNQCDNKLCLHPDWRCNGHNECGDFSDERNCNSVPIPPDNKPAGYSAVSFWLAFTLMFATGGILGVAGPVLYQKYQNGQYRRFSDIQ